MWRVCADEMREWVSRFKIPTVQGAIFVAVRSSIVVDAEVSSPSRTFPSPFLFESVFRWFDLKMMRSVVLLSLYVASLEALLVPKPSRATTYLRETAEKTKSSGSVAEELGIPCEDECAIGSFPNLPESVHPGVLSGQAQMDLLNHAKENGMWLSASLSPVECIGT